MGLALGFGSTEQAFEDDEERAMRDEIERRFRDQPVSYFTDDFVRDFKTWVSARAYGFRAQADSYKNADEFPDRYSYYYPTVLSDASHIVVVARMLHVNRRHAMSPDGWALLRTRPAFVFDNLDMERNEQAEAA